MKWKIAAILAVSALFVVILSARLLEQTENTQLRMAAGQGITEEPALQVTDVNLVDLLSALPLHARIVRADLRGTTLTVDLKVRSSASGTGPVYEDMAELGSLALLRSHNINQLRLRLVAEDAWTGRQHLLLASEMDRSDLSGDTGQLLEGLKTAGNAPLGENLKARLRIVETALWKKAYPQSDI
ncbi:hypothetical protein AWM70_09875 [Paenibacillus yonginensis]|uniref:Uncharacterized protein n=2 Tax=Paenibacillus yonginensis TaxID=1462996 RepID=A0A1B1N0D4_9BACL|nr:hypothetical protein AWM70_09875 [Paenibacillus yonginensis]